MKEIIFIADTKITSIPIIECNEPLVNIKYEDNLQYGPAPECELTASDYTKIRKSIFEKLLKAQADLPKGWRFRLYEGFRSLKVQQLLFDQEFQRVQAKYPRLTFEEQFHETTRLISPVINLDGSQNVPPHNTGSAIDIEIVTQDGQLVDMGMAAKDWPYVDSKICATQCKTVSKTAQTNRKLLCDIMQAHGFVNYPTEWWHFSYGDRYWAYFQSAKHAIYNSADFL